MDCNKFDNVVRRRAGLAAVAEKYMPTCLDRIGPSTEMRLERVRLHPFDAGNRIGRVIDQVAHEQTGVKRLVNRRQGGPIGVNVSQNQNLHGFFGEADVPATKPESI